MIPAAEIAMAEEAAAMTAEELASYLAEHEAKNRTDPRIIVLRALMNNALTNSDRLTVVGYKLAVIAVCDALEMHALPGELGSSGEPLTLDSSFGPTLAAVRRHFGFIA